MLYNVTITMWRAWLQAHCFLGRKARRLRRRILYRVSRRKYFELWNLGKSQRNHVHVWIHTYDVQTLLPYAPRVTTLRFIFTTRRLKQFIRPTSKWNNKYSEQRLYCIDPAHLIAWIFDPAVSRSRGNRRSFYSTEFWYPRARADDCLRFTRS